MPFSQQRQHPADALNTLRSRRIITPVALLPRNNYSCMIVAPYASTAMLTMGMKLDNSHWLRCSFTVSCLLVGPCLRDFRPRPSPIGFSPSDPLRACAFRSLPSVLAVFLFSGARFDGLVSFP